MWIPWFRVLRLLNRSNSTLSLSRANGLESLWNTLTKRGTTRKRKKVVIAVAAIVAFVSLYPFEITVVPAWDFALSDESGDPMPNVKVRQRWHYYPLHRHPYEQDSISDGFGYVKFPKRTITASLIQMVLFSALWKAKDGRTGPYSEIKVPGEDSITNGIFVGGEPQRFVRVTRLALMPLARDSVMDQAACLVQ